MNPTRSRLQAALATLLLVASIAAPCAAAERCLAGASAKSDRLAIDLAREAIEVACPCSAASSPGSYLACARGVVRSAVEANTLRRECRTSVNRLSRKSVCGRPAGDAPCLRQRTIEGAPLSCSIGPASKCTDGPAGRVRRLACPGYSHCLDATDADGDHAAETPDDGLRCAVRLATLDLTSSAEPPHTPGSPGTVVSNAKLIEQFGGTGFSLNNARYTRFTGSHPGVAPDAVLILVPGFEGGAGGFRVLAENLIPRLARDHGLVLEIWAHDRRTNQLEDRAGLELAEQLGDPLVALDWLFGGELGLTMNPALASGPNRRGVFYDAQADLAFIAGWTNLVFSRDIDTLVTAADAEVKNHNVFLGGHSAGTGFAARYAATDFNSSGMGPVQPGFAKLRGLVLLEGGGGSVPSTAPTADTLDRIEAKFDGGLYGAVRANAPRCVDGVTACTIATEATACAGQVPPKCTDPTTAYSLVPGLLNPRILAAVEPPAIQGATDPDGGQIILQVDQGSPGNNAIAKVPDLATLALLPQATVMGGIGSFVDDDGLISSLASFVATSAGATGPVVGGLTTWQDIAEGPMPTAAVPNNGPPPTAYPPATRWGQEKEVSSLARLLTTFVAGGTNFTDWYYPNAGPSTTSVSGLCTAGTCTVGNVGAACSANSQCSQSLGLDSSPLSLGRGRRDIENLTQAASIDVPVIALGGSNGLTPVPGSFLAFAQTIADCNAPSCDGTARVIDPGLPSAAFPTFGEAPGGFEVHISEGFAHVDVLAAEDDGANQVLAPLAAFIDRNTQ